MINVLLIFAAHKFCALIVSFFVIYHILWKIILRQLQQSTIMKIIVRNILNMKTIVLY